jgi:hypothetical protein
MGIATRPVPQDEDNAWPDPPQQACIFSCLFLHFDESRAPSLFHTGTLHPPSSAPRRAHSHVQTCALNTRNETFSPA